MILKCLAMRKQLLQPKSARLVSYQDPLKNMTTLKTRRFHVLSSIQRKLQHKYKHDYRKHHLLGMSMIENLSFDDRAEIMGKSYNSHVLILNFSDPHII